MDISTRFSENRCSKVLPLAESTYQQELPPFYITSYHQSRLRKAKHVYSQYARGPCYDKYMQELEASCVTYWKAGRQQCEAVSLNGNLCIRKVHCLPGEEVDGLEVGEHCSQVKTKAACNCGRIQADKDDPFSIKSANYDFYQELEELCCSKLEHISLPAFSPSTPDPRAASVVTSGPPPVISSPESQQTAVVVGNATNKDDDKPDAFATLSELSLALSLGQNVPQSSELEQKSSPCDNSQKKTAPVIKPETRKKEASRSGPQRQASTTEYLASMIHSRSPAGLLPLFSSFSVCRLGPCNYYSHLVGLDLPGFLPGSSFLLPWDIHIKTEQAWPTVAETFVSGKKRAQRKLSKGPEGGEQVTTVRVYLGMEYECPRGHRFFCSGPDKTIKVSTNSIVKDNASRLVHMDMPLYTSCHCKQLKGCMAQMMRIYVASPRDSPSAPSVRVMVNPRVQPGPAGPSGPGSSSGCPQFHTGLDEPLELPADGLWVIRLPSIYQDENRVYLMPADHQQVHSCVVIGGMFSYKKL